MAANNLVAAPGERSLDVLLASLEPVLHPQTYVFVTLPATSALPSSVVQSAQMLFREVEGLTLILTQTEAADSQFECTFPCRKITLNVHSSLEAVGLIAAVAGALTRGGIGTNPVSGFFHDHLFVPEGTEEAAVRILLELVDEAKTRSKR